MPGDHDDVTYIDWQSWKRNDVQRNGILIVFSLSCELKQAISEQSVLTAGQTQLW